MPHAENPLLRLLTALEVPDTVFAVISSSSILKPEHFDDRTKFRKILDNDRRRISQLVNLADDFGLSFMKIACHYPAHKTGEKFTDNCVLIESGVCDEAFLKLFCETAARLFNQESFLFTASSGKVSLCFPDAPDSDLGVFRAENFSEFISCFLASGNSVPKNDMCFGEDGFSFDFDLREDKRPELHRGQYSLLVINGRRDYLQVHHCFPPSIKKWLSDWSKLDTDPEIA